MPRKDFDAMSMPVKKPDETAAPSKTRKSKSKTRSQSPNRAGQPKIKLCYSFLKNGICDVKKKTGSNCQLEHLNQEQLTAKREKLKKQAAEKASPSGKGKGRGKGKGKGKRLKKKKKGGPGAPAVGQEDAETEDEYSEWEEWDEDYDSDWGTGQEE